MLRTRTLPVGSREKSGYFRGYDYIRRAVDGNNDGFTFIELVVTIAIISILFLITVPRISRLINTERNSFVILTSMIVKTFDDAFLHNKTNYFVVHMKKPDYVIEESELNKNLPDLHNAVSIINVVNGRFIGNKRKTLQSQEFSPDKFLIEEVVKPGGEKLTSGNAWIPFYPQGYSDNVIIHILVNGEQKWSIKINKQMKEPKVLEGYVTYESEN